MKVAVIGSGISGLAAAHYLGGHAEVTLFEASDYFGGHTHTVDVTLATAGGDMVTHGVDTGFLVFNERTYPHLIRLFGELGVATAKSAMTFSVQVAASGNMRRLEWSGSNLNSVFAQRRNLLSLPFLSMLRDLTRFNAVTTQIALNGSEDSLRQPLGEFLDAYGFGEPFRNWYFLPMMGCIWSCPTRQMLQFPVATMIRFCHNHGLLHVRNRPQWHTVAGGARRYVDKLVCRIVDTRLATPVRSIQRPSDDQGGGVNITTDHATERFDRAVVATHSDQALALLQDPTPAERATLGNIRYQPNRAVLHTDTSVLPTERSAWAAWNYESTPQPHSIDTQPERGICLHYLINLLQPLPWEQPVVVSLNPLRDIPRNRIMGEYHYMHPVFDQQAIQAQGQLERIQGQRDTFFCGAWTGYGFHEDGLKSGQAVAQQILSGARPQP